MYTGKKILIVDDEPDLREILNDEFASYGAQVVQATNGVEALALARAQMFDLIVSDIRMPGGDGLTFARTLKADSSTSPPIVLITGFADLLPDEAYDIGVEVFYQKPFPLDTLVASLEKYLVPVKDRYLESNAKGKQDLTAVTLSISSTISEALHRGQFLPARGGAFMRAEQFAHRVGSRVEIHFPDGILFNGFVRWTRQDMSSHLPRGFGFEFEKLSSEAFVWLEAWKEKNSPIAYIPRR